MVSSRNVPNHQSLLKLADQFPDLDLPSVETCLTFLDTTADVYHAFDTHFARHGLSMAKFSLLMQLFQLDEEGLMPSEFAERVGVTRATITGLLDGLEREGLVTREPHPGDRRKLNIRLTNLGRDRLVDMLPDHFCRTTHLMAGLTREEKQTFMQLLKKLRAGTPAMHNP